jgi:multidrug efflux pump subunit AcrB
MLNFATRARPYFGAVVLTTVLLVAGGVYSYTLMPRGIYPEVTFPRIAVVARVPGLSVANTQVLVTRPLEEAVTTVPGVAQVRSKTIRGSSELSIDFNPGTDMLRAEQLTWNRIGTARSGLPQEVKLTVDRMTPSVFPILSLVLIGGKDATHLRDYAYYYLAPRIKTIPEVLYANVAGGDIREIEVEPRPADLRAAGLSAADLADQIRQSHILQPVGNIQRPPFAFQVLVDTQGETPRKIEELVLATHGNQTLRVSDVADVRVGHQDRMLSVGYAGRDAVVITVFRSPGGNTVKISGEVRALLARHAPPGNIQATVVYDQATFITTAVHNVRDAIVVGGAFSVLILLGFLRSWRATLISALAIPTTLAITFLILHAIGETLNLMSLGGLAVAVGLIIDDTVVVIENIARHLSPDARRGAPAAIDAVAAASAEITGAVVGSSFTTVLVFVPLAFITGVYGQFFASLTWSLSIAVLVSMVVSLTLVPVFAARFLAGKPMPGPGLIYRFLAGLYEKAMGWALRFHWVTLACSLGAIGIGYLLYTGIPSFQSQEPGQPPPAPLMKALPTGLMPDMDEGAFVLDYRAPSGTPLDGTQSKARELERVLSQNPDVDAYVRRTGAELGIYATQTNRGDIQVILRPAPENLFTLLTQPVRPELDEVLPELKELGRQEAERRYGPRYTQAQMWEEGKAAIRRKYRRRSAAQIMDEVEGAVRELFSEHQLKIETVQIMQDELNDLSGANRPVEVQLFGPNYAALRRLAKEVGATLEQKGLGRGLRDINSGVHRGNPDLLIKPEAVRARRLALTADDIKRQLQAMYQGMVATQVRESAVRITDVRVRYANALRFGPGSFDPDRLLNQWLLLPEQPPAAGMPPSPATLSGAARSVPLYAVARLERVLSPDEEWRQNLQPAIFVTSDINERKAGLGAVVADIRRWMTGVAVPPGYRWELGGHYLHQQEAFASLFMVMVIAVFLVYIMLAFQFRSVVLPLTIFLTEPLSLVSGLLALWLTNTPLNVSSFMGAVLLIGLDMKNGILIVEYVQQLRKEGMELRPALLLAGKTRFRPILMTSLAAILGLFPLALGVGPGAQMQQPLAIMVIGGLTANMLFTRMVIPVAYLVLERKAKRAGPTAEQVS